MLNIVAAILLFGFIVLVHEFGHFLLAKLNGIGVVDFSIGMGPRLVSLVKTNGTYKVKLLARPEADALAPESETTVYSLKLLPFGGSCMMVGEDSDVEHPDPNAFGNKPVFARILVIAAGPVFNFILAFLFAIVIVGAVGHDAPVLYGVTEGSPAQEAGLQAGDRITKINGRKIYAYRDVQLYTFSHPGEQMVIHYERPADGTWETKGAFEKRSVTLTPAYSQEYQTYLIGVQFRGYEKVHGIGELISDSVYEVRYCVVSTFDSIRMLVHRQVKVDEAISGPVGIVGMVGETVQEGREVGTKAVVLVLSNWVLLLSSSLGIMNLLPIPALDGGRLLFLLIELVRRKPTDPKIENAVHMAGMMVLMALMVLVLFNDISKLIIR